MDPEVLVVSRRLLGLARVVLSEDSPWSGVDLLARAGFQIAWDRDIADPMEHGAHLFVLARRDDSATELNRSH